MYSLNLTFQLAGHGSWVNDDHDHWCDSDLCDKNARLSEFVDADDDNICDICKTGVLGCGETEDCDLNAALDQVKDGGTIQLLADHPAVKKGMLFAGVLQNPGLYPLRKGFHVPAVRGERNSEGH